MYNYGGGTGFYYCNPFLNLYVQPQNLNVGTLNNVTAMQRGTLNNVTATQRGTLNNVAAMNRGILNNLTATKRRTLNNVTATKRGTWNNVTAPKRGTLNYVTATKRADISANAPCAALVQEKRKNGPCIVTLSNALPQFNANQNANIQKEEKIDSNEQIDMAEEENDAQPELDILVNNVVTTFNVRCHLNLRQIALEGANVEYIRDRQVVCMKLRKPSITAKIYSSGKVICTGATSNEDAKSAARRVARILQKLGYKIRFTDYKVVNVLCTCYMYFGINLNKFTEKHRRLTSFEPELHPGATYRVKEHKATLKLFTTGSITITAPSTDNVQRAVEHIFPLVYEFRTAKPPAKKPKCHNNQMSKGVFQGGYSSSDEENYLQGWWC